MARGSGEGISRRGGQKRAATSEETQHQFAFGDGQVLFFKSQQQLSHYVQLFANRKIMPPKYITEQYLSSKGFNNLLLDLVESKVFQFCSLKKDFINPILVRAFYSNLVCKSDHGGYIQTMVNGVKIKVNEVHISEMTGLPYGNQTLYGPPYHDDGWVENNEGDVLHSMGITHPTRHHTGRPTIARINEESWVLLYLVTRVLHPRGHGHTIIQQEDLMVVHAIRNHVELNWAHYILLHMSHCVEHNLMLPYAILVMHILESHGIDTSKGEKLKRTKIWNITDTTFRGGRQGEEHQEEGEEEEGQEQRPVQASLSSIAEAIQGMRSDIQEMRIDMGSMNQSISRVEFEQQRLGFEVRSYFESQNYTPPPFRLNPQAMPPPRDEDQGPNE